MNTNATIILRQIYNYKTEETQSPRSNNKMFEWSLSSGKSVNCPPLGIPTWLSNAVWELMCMSGHSDTHTLLWLYKEKPTCVCCFNDEWAVSFCPPIYRLMENKSTIHIRSPLKPCHTSNVG